MPAALLGTKLGMTQIFEADGRVTPVTVIEAGPCVVTQVKTVEKDGYSSIQLGFGVAKESRLTKAEKGPLRQARCIPRTPSHRDQARRRRDPRHW